MLQSHYSLSRTPVCLVKAQLTHDSKVDVKKKLPDFALWYVAGKRGTPHGINAPDDVFTHEHLLKYYKGDCLVNDIALLAVCEAKALPKYADLPETLPRRRFRKAFTSEMRQKIAEARQGAYDQLCVYFSDLADRGKHADGVVAIAAAGPFYSWSLCESEHITYLSNNADPTYRDGAPRKPAKSGWPQKQK